ncbi:MAG: AzlD domain-containing protein [Trueperella sp.]|nr:AzlD domain-containing protein [Trueperella sp.]
MTQYILAVVVMTWAITFVLRAMPFLFLTKVRDSAALKYLGKVMPAGVMLILVVFTLRGLDLTTPESWLPAAAGVITTVVLHLLLRKVLLSILGGAGVFALVLSFC